MPDATVVTIAGIALTDSAFTDGGGYLADATGGIAVLLDGGSFSRGAALTVRGVVDDRYSQRTIRAGADGVTSLGIGAEPARIAVTTGSIGESVEGRLVEIEATIVSSPTTLSAGVAFDVDDGSGVVRVLLNGVAGIDADLWQRGVSVHLVGVVGQRDSGGTGLLGYRVQPRDANDILALTPPATPTPSPSPTPTPTPTASSSSTPMPTPTPTPPPGELPLMTIAEARNAAKNAVVRLRGVVTVASDVIEPGSAVIQDATAGILVRLSDEAGSLQRGEVVELIGIMSTKSGMLAVRVTAPPGRLGTAVEPTPAREATGRLGEELEARLVVTRGALTEKPRRSSANNVSFGIDDGTGEIRIFISPRAGIDVSALRSGDWIEVRGVLGQETSGSQPDRGYRIWPRTGSDLSVLAAAVAGGGTSSASGSRGGSDGRGPSGSGVVGSEGSSASGSSTAGGDHDSQPPSLGTDEPAVLPMPVLAGGTAGNASAAESTVAATTASSARASFALDRNPLRALGLLVVSMAALLALGVLAWRSGAAGRLLETMTGAASEAPARDVGSPEAEPLAQLTVLRGPSEQAGP